MGCCFIFKLLAVTWFTVTSKALPVTNEDDAALYLSRFGYIQESAAGDAELVTAAIKDFQRFAGIQETGTLDTQTMNMMNTPRCSLKDKVRRSQSIRKKRYALEGSKWHVNEITYHIKNYPTRMSDNVMAFKNEIIRAFKAWSDVAKIDFKEKPEGSADIEIQFVSGNHGDWSAFDGPGGVLAHAFFPQYGGDAHFDNDEVWAINNRYATNIFQTAAHEFGHSLGLLHSNQRLAVMYPFISYIPGFQLHSDDIAAIRSIYGPRYQPPSPDDENLGPQPDTSDAPNLCEDAEIDTITRTQDGSTYAFKGNFYWKLISTGGIASGYPRKISEDWGGLEGNLDASVTWDSGLTYFFKGNRYWRFTNRNMASGYPKYISQGWPGIPEDLDAAFLWGGNGKTYFFKGDKYWRFDFGSDPPVSTAYPQPASAWSSMIANGIDAALKWENGLTYFFKDGQYYRYNDQTEQVDNGYPISTAIQWFNCV